MRKRRPRAGLPAWRRVPGAATVCALGLAVLGWSGCGGEARDAEGGQAVASARVEAADPADPAIALADSLLPRLEALAGLSATGPLRLARRSRAELRSFVAGRLAEDLPPEEAVALRDLYALLGVIPDTLDLGRLFLDLYTEQVAGYYDPEADTLFLVEGMPPGQLEGILAHELVHALQDQHAPLDSLIHRERGNDRQTAAQAALEGHATMVMLALSAERMTGRALDPDRLPDPAVELAGAMAAQTAAFPVFGAAPPFIRHSLLFPYVQGASFVRRLWLHRAADVRYPAPLGPRLPLSTEQVLHPEAAFLDGRDAPTELVVAAPDAGWRVRYEDTLGEFETGLVLGDAAAAAGWDGDRVLLLAGPGGETAALWYSVWDTPAAAERFAAAARQLVAGPGGRRGLVDVQALDGRPCVVVRLGGAPGAVEGVPLPAVRVADGG